MKWQIPAKTFLLGEYAAIAGASAIVLTTSPCFTMELATSNQKACVHPDSPAGKWWANYSQFSQNLSWLDPYFGKGGLGASSAQFLGAYLASCYLEHKTACLEVMLDAYYLSAWQGQGLRPSGYDVLAQSQHQCVYINRQKKIIQSYPWSFRDISFLLLHTGKKLPTHHYLQTTALTNAINLLSNIVDEAKIAFEEKDSEKIVFAVNAYQQCLTTHKLTAQHSLEKLQYLKKTCPNILAAKGCGAMGADVLLIILPSSDLEEQVKMLTTKGWDILASSNDMYEESALINKKLV
jgi:mevalonate kinase